MSSRQETVATSDIGLPNGLGYLYPKAIALIHAFVFANDITWR